MSVKQFFDYLASYPQTADLASELAGVLDGHRAGTPIWERRTA